MKLQFAIGSIVFLGAMLLPGRIHAQITCAGEGCALLPYSPAVLDSTFLALQRQYTDRLMDDMARASTLAATAGPPMGTVNLQRFTAGVHLGVGYVPIEKVDVTVPGFGTYYGLTKAGAGVSPRAFFGVNLGALFASSYDISSAGGTPSMLSPARFDFYFTALERVETLQTNGETKGDVTGNVYARGFEIRYHLVEGNDLGIGALLRFRGVSVGIGSYHSRMDIDYRQTKSKISYQPASSAELTWEGENRFHYASSVDTYPVDVRTGIQLMTFLNITVGGGMVWSKGSSEVEFNRTGPVYLKSDLASALGYAFPSAVLTARIKGNGDVPPQMAFGRVGLEFNITIVKLSFEYMIAKGGVKGGNVGVRVEI